MKRLAKIFLLVLLTLLLVLAALVVYVRIKYPSEKLRQVVIAALAEKFHVQAQIESLSFHLFSGFTLKQLTLSALAPNHSAVPSNFKTALSVDEIMLSYRWRSVFSGSFDIDALTLSRPSIAYWQADSATNLDALFAALADTAALSQDTSATNLPFTLNVNTIQIDELRINLAFATQVDTRRLALGPLALAIEELTVDRAAAYRASFKLGAEAAPFAYSLHTNDSTHNVEYRSRLNADLAGRASLDSLAARGGIAFAQNALRYGETALDSLPEIALQAEAHYHLPSSHLTLPSFAVALNKKEILAARYERRMHESTAVFDLHAERGALDLTEISQLLHQLGDLVSPALQQLEAAGHLDFSGSELHKTPAGLRHQLHVRGENLCYRDASLGLKLDSGNVRLVWRNLDEDGSDAATAFESDISFRAFDFPRDAATMHTGAGAISAKGFLDKNFSPQNLSWELSLKNISGGDLRSEGRFKKTRDNSGLDLRAAIEANNIELAPFTADTLQGRVGGKVTLTGTEWSNLQVACALRHDALNYLLEEDRMRFPPVDWTLNAKLALAPDFSDWQFTLGTLRGEPATANFTARYQTTPGVFRFDLNNADLKLDYVLGILPRSLFEGLNPKLAGASTANGWMNFDFSNSNELEYVGKFFVNSNRAAFTDDSLGIYADWLELKSVWDLATNKTTGDFTLNLRETRMPDYVRLPLPFTIANGKIELEEETFVIKEGRFNAPSWQLQGDYRVLGNFLRQSLRVETTVNAAMATTEFVKVDRGLSLKGKLAGRMVLEQFFPEDKEAAQPARLDLKLHAEQLTVRMDTLLALDNMNAELSFAQDFDFRTLELSSPQNAEPRALANANEAMLLYDLLGEPLQASNAPASQLEIGKLRVFDYEFSDIVARLNLGQGRFDIPELRLNFLGGNMRGNVLVGYGNGAPEELTYSTALQISSLDVSRLRRIAAEVEKSAQLSADFYLTGKGAAANQLEETLNNLTGKLNITKIEKKTATNLLAALDPNGADAGIQRMRLLLKTGWNVKHMTFEVKNGFVYASLAPVKTKPWAALFNLPTTLDFARLPIKYFLPEE